MEIDWALTALLALVEIAAGCNAVDVLVRGGEGGGTVGSLLEPGMSTVTDAAVLSPADVGGIERVMVPVDSLAPSLDAADWKSAWSSGGRPLTTAMACAISWASR